VGGELLAVVLGRRCGPHIEDWLRRTLLFVDRGLGYVEVEVEVEVDGNGEVAGEAV
jgi:hypothetical protein